MAFQKNELSLIYLVLSFDSEGGIKLLPIILHSDLFYTIHLRMSTLNLFVNKNFTFILTQCLLM